MIIFKQEPLDLPYLKICDEKEKSRETCRIIYDSYFEDDDVVDLSQITQQSSDNERCSNSRIISVKPRSRETDHLHSLIVQDNILIYDSYHEQTPIPVPSQNLSSDSQDGIRNCSDPIILANSCKEEDVSNHSQLCCNISCIDNHYVLSHFHSFCTKSDFVLNFHIFDKLQAIKIKISYSQTCMSYALLIDLQFITEIHPDFHDPIDIQLEERFHEKEIPYRIPTEVTLSYSTSNVNNPRKVLLPTLMFKRYIRVGIKMKRWFHWKYHFT